VYFDKINTLLDRFSSVIRKVRAKRNRKTRADWVIRCTVGENPIVGDTWDGLAFIWVSEHNLMPLAFVKINLPKFTYHTRYMRFNVI
jgi:hypothetical protein